jgi:ADP-ribose pyrophosphatase YjhB (NUDIX family)
MREVVVPVLVALGAAGVLLLYPRLRRLLENDTSKWSSAGGIVVNDAGEIALVLQRGRTRRLRWTLPKGRVDAGETIEAAALREIYEETGLRTRLVRPIALHDGDRHFVHYFELKLEHDDGVHDRETKEVRFVAVTKAAKMLRSRRDLAVLRRFVELRTGVKG